MPFIEDAAPAAVECRSRGGVQGFVVFDLIGWPDGEHWQIFDAKPVNPLQELIEPLPNVRRER
jgi:hypothetical protein